jgi:hypothetical protein
LSVCVVELEGSCILSYQRLFQHLDSSYRPDRSCLRRWCRWCEAS